jgi:hypothetical protein
MPFAKMKARHISPQNKPERTASQHETELLQDLSVPNLRVLPQPKRPLATMKARPRSEKKS